MSPRPKKSEAGDTRQEILDAALMLFSRHGFAGASMRQLAREVGVRESALYHHFESKEVLFEALFLKYGPPKLPVPAQLDLDAALRRGVRPFLSQLIEGVFEEWAKPEAQMVARLMLTEGLRLSLLGKLQPEQYALAARKRVADVLAELMRRKLIRKLDPEFLALELIGPLALMRLLFLVLARGVPDTAQIRALAEQHVDFFLAGAAT